MRVCYMKFVLLVTAAAFISSGDAISTATDSDFARLSKMAAGDVYTATQVKEAARRSLRSYDLDDLDQDDSEERMNFSPEMLAKFKVLTPEKLDELVAKEKAAYDPSNIERVFENAKDGKLGGWLDKDTLDGLLGSRHWSFEKKKKVLDEWKAAGKTPEELKKLLQTSPALTYKYSFVYQLFNGF